MESTAKSIEEKIYSFRKPGFVFAPRDFATLGSDESIRQTLTRLANKGVIRRIGRGLYDKPQYNNYLGKIMPPNYYEAAMAIARANNWTVAPSGNTALNQLGLSTQVSAHWTFVSDGPYKKYSINGNTIEFKRRANREISHMAPKTIMVVQALKALGKSTLTDDFIQRLNANLKDCDKQNLLAETNKASAWVRDVVGKVCRGK